MSNCISKLPINIKESNKIIDYSIIYLKAKSFINDCKTFEKYDDNNKNLYIQKLLLLITFIGLVDMYNIKKFFDNCMINNLKQSKTYYMWNKMQQVFINPLKAHNTEYTPNKKCTFLDIEPICDNIIFQLCEIIFPMCNGKDFVKLLPYILEAFEYETKYLNVENYKVISKYTKKINGIYYTPKDVVNYIIDNTLEKYVEDNNYYGKQIDKQIDELKNIKILDASCGTGVFLLEVINRLITKYNALIKQHPENFIIKCPLTLSIKNNIYGVDKSATAIQSCIFMILFANIKILAKSDYSPYQIYCLALLNIKQGDSITSASPKFSKCIDKSFIQKLNLKIRSTYKKLILEGTLDSTFNEAFMTKYKLLYENKYGFYFEFEYPEVFSNNNGFTCIIGNPPYVKASNIHLCNEQISYYESCSNRNNVNLYMYFVENLIKLSSDLSYSGLIVPLSISYNTNNNFKKLRKLIENDIASWKFAFFDRSPDSIFGDNVKTRACILFSETENKLKKSIYTTKLQRWSSMNRDNLFKEIFYSQNIDYDIVNYIPKLESNIEVKTFKKLYSNSAKLGNIIQIISQNSCSESGSKIDDTIYFYNTAYNWISVFIDVPDSWDKDNNKITLNSVSLIKCSENKYFIYALLTSTITYWLWIVQGDIFHVSKTFIEHLPFDTSLFSNKAYNNLIQLGQNLWEDVLKNKTVKVNAGKRIGNYSYIQSLSIINKINSTIIKELNISKPFNTFINNWYIHMLSAGRKDFKYSDYFMNKN